MSLGLTGKKTLLSCRTGNSNNLIGGFLSLIEPCNEVSSSVGMPEAEATLVQWAPDRIQLSRLSPQLVQSRRSKPGRLLYHLFQVAEAVVMTHWHSGCNNASKHADHQLGQWSHFARSLVASSSIFLGACHSIVFWQWQG
jgi:hypothetical protein